MSPASSHADEIDALRRMQAGLGRSIAILLKFMPQDDITRIAAREIRPRVEAIDYWLEQVALAQGRSSEEKMTDVGGVPS